VNPQGVPSVTVSDIPDISGDLPSDIVLLDVREDDEWTAGHAPQALHIPMGQVADRLAELPADANLYVVCRLGGRSAKVTAYLNANGWDAVNVDGGMRSWADTGRPLVCELPNTEPEII
jgi:rhodanese-related sulfurtransferase